MNAVEIEEAVSALAEAPFDAEAFPFAFLAAFGNKDTAIKRLRAGATNQSDLPGGVLQRSNIHILVAPQGQVAEALGALRDSPRTKSAKARYVLATDGVTLEAEDLSSGETVACAYADLPNHFGFFLPLAGITTVRQIRESAFDIRATSRLNRLYVELLKDNPDWGSPERRSAMNHFMARLIFCFFAEDTGIFPGQRRFTLTIDQMSARDSSNTHEVIEALFQAMNTKSADRAAAGIPRWADAFPYVNGGLFSGGTEVPRFSKIARSYLLHIGNLDWRQINPDIFGSMIQAVADDEERGALGMHYTSVPNILKVLDPLFLDDLRAQLEAAGDNARMLLNLRKRMSRIRVFDPACGSGNFLVIAYKQMREIEAEINRRRAEPDRRTDIPLTNFRGIELREFPAEIARLALIIAEYQADELHRGQKEAVRDFLPLDKENWITCGNALRLDWVKLCPPSGIRVILQSDDLFGTPLAQAEIDFENQGGETYICGNPPFKGARKQTKSQKSDMEFVFGGGHDHKDCDYVSAWYLKASEYANFGPSDFAFVSTNSIARGEQVEHIWSRLYGNGDSIRFCHVQFKWQNNAQNNAGVWCVIIGASRDNSRRREIYDGDTVRYVPSISPYLLNGSEDYIKQSAQPLSAQMPKLVSGNMARDGGNLIIGNDEKRDLLKAYPQAGSLVRPLIGTTEIRQGSRRWCLWIEDDSLPVAQSIPPVHERIERTRAFREASSAKTTVGYARTPHRFAQRCQRDEVSIVLPKNTVEGIPYLTPDLAHKGTVTTDLAFVTFTQELWVLAVLSSAMHRVWAEAISGGLGAGVRYSSLITYNAFPLPTLTTAQREELCSCAEDILLAREANFPLTIADLYDPEKFPGDLRDAHDKNDETLERIFIGRRFRNDTERLEKLFELYTKMATTPPSPRRASPPQEMT